LFTQPAQKHTYSPGLELDDEQVPVVPPPSHGTGSSRTASAGRREVERGG